MKVIALNNIPFQYYPIKKGNVYTVIAVKGNHYILAEVKALGYDKLFYNVEFETLAGDLSTVPVLGGPSPVNPRLFAHA